MAFTERSIGVLLSNINSNLVLGSQTSGHRVIIKSVIIANRDTVAHNVTIKVTFNSQSTPGTFEFFTITMNPADTLVQDFPIVLYGSTDALIGILGEATVTNAPHCIITYAEAG